MKSFRSRRVIAAAATLALSAAIGIGTAAPASARPVSGNEWEITSVGAAHTTYGAWHTCVTITPHSSTSTATCSIDTSVSSSVSGTVEVGTAAVTAAVGFDVTHTFEVDASQSFTIPANAGGTLQWRAVYSTKTVKQTEYHYPLLGARTVVATATVEANKYTSPTFRYES